MLKQRWQLAWHFYRQASLQQRLLTWVQGILLVFILTLSQTSASIQAYLAQNLDQLLGADLVLSQAMPLSDSQQTALAGMSSQIVLTQSLELTFTHQQQWQTGLLKAVAADYPLQGELRSSRDPSGSDTSSSRGPVPGEIWLDARLFSSLGLQIGDTLSLGASELTVSRILQHEPDRLLQGHSVQMRALVHRQHLAQMQRPGDRILHRYLVAASKAQIAQIRDWQQQFLPAAELYHKQGAHPLALFWQRTENVLGLASIVLFFMAAIALQQLSRLQRQQEHFFTAVCLSLGASRPTALQIAVCKWLFGVLGMLPLALIFAMACHWLLVDWLAHTFTELHWRFNPSLALQTVAACVLIFMLFQIPLWFSLQRAGVRQLIQPSPQPMHQGLFLLSALGVLSAIAAYYSDNLLLTAMVLLALLSCVGVLLLLSWLLLSIGEKFSQPFSGLLPFVLYMMKQRLMSKSTQILGTGLAAFLLLFTLMLLKDLGNSMTLHQRKYDGNLLVSQATSAQMADIEAWAAAQNIAIRQQKPFLYAKLTQINGIALAQTQHKPSDSLASFNQPVRMHWTAQLPDNNRLSAGEWWPADTANWQQVSLEQEVMTDLGLKLGDRLGFVIEQQQVDFILTASHVYQSGAGAITFWVQVPPAILQHVQAPRYSMASLELTAAQFSQLSALWQKHPSLRMVSLQELTARFDRILAMVTTVISGFVVFISLLAALVIVISVHAVEAQERKKNSVILSFGLSKATCLKLNLLEWLITGAIAGSGAIAATWLAGSLIYQSQFALPYQPNFVWLLATLLILLSLVTALGFAVSKHSLRASVRQLMLE